MRDRHHLRRPAPQRVLIYTPNLRLDSPHVVVTSTRPALAHLVLGSATADDLSVAGSLTVSAGDVSAISDVFGLLEPFTFWFNIVTP